jgi:hypothetical protein
MSRGLGRVQTGCLVAIWEYERGRHCHRRELPTTYDIANDVYRIEPDADGACWITDAQHIAVKRALAGLQRKGQVIGFRMDHSERHFRWMSEKRAQQWVRDKKNADRGVREKMRAIGMEAR